MKLIPNFIFCIAIIFTSYGQAKKADVEPLKIAYVGNSITYGAGMGNREKNAYPKQLQVLLGDKYEVKNFGVNGNTLLKKGDYPYWESDKYQEALAFAPDVVYIKLGTNDSKILFFGPLPTGLDKNSVQRKKYDAIHESINYLGDKPSIYYYNVVEQFYDEKGNLSDVYYGGDGIHLKNEGYNVWGNL